MYGIKILLNSIVILFVVCALVLVWADSPACGVLTAKCVASLFIVIALLAQREAAKLWLTIDMLKSYKRKSSMMRVSNTIMMMWRMNIWGIFGKNNVVCCSFRLRWRRIMMSKGNCSLTLIISPSIFSFTIITIINDA